MFRLIAGFLICFSFVMDSVDISATDSQNRVLSPSSSPESPGFSTLINGKDVLSLRSRGRALQWTKGGGKAFDHSALQRYQALMASPNENLQWQLIDLDARKVLKSSSSPERLFYGASVTKPIVAGALVAAKAGQGSLPWQQLIDMLVISSNSAWQAVQLKLGDGRQSLGQERVIAFTNELGMAKTVGFRGWYGKIHGNETTTQDLSKFLMSTYHNQYKGADLIWKLMHTVRTGRSRGDLYLPKSLYIAGKTGTYNGSTIRPGTGKAYRASVRHHMLSFRYHDRQYGLVMMTDGYANRDLAILAGGLWQELFLSLSKKLSRSR